jgi:CheY-like chemotaxis protein
MLTRRQFLGHMAVAGTLAALPSLPEFTPLPEPSHNLRALTASRPILLSDDDHGNVFLLKLILERQGLTVVGTISSSSALRIAQTFPLSLIISDVMTPDMDGYTLLQHLKADIRTRNIPFMFLTARTLLSDRDYGMQLGADDYLTKPTHPHELYARVERLLLERTDWRQPFGTPVHDNFPDSDVESFPLTNNSYQGFYKGRFGRIMPARPIAARRTS